MTKLERMQKTCLEIIHRFEKARRWPTTYDIAAGVYRIKPDNGVQLISSAQHAATKRALEALQRQGRIIGFDTGQSPPRDGIRAWPKRYKKYERGCFHWMTEERAAKWVAEQRSTALQLRSNVYANPEYFTRKANRVVRKGAAIGMKLESASHVQNIF
jgi:hypothetical protein